MSLKKIHTDQAPQAVGPYSQAIQTGNMLFCSGQIPLDPSSMKMVEGGIQEQAHQVLKNLGAVLNAAGSDYKKVIKTTVLLQNMDDFKTVNEIYAEYFDPTGTPPARAAYEVARLPLGSLIEIEAVALV